MRANMEKQQSFFNKIKQKIPLKKMNIILIGGICLLCICAVVFSNFSKDDTKTTSQTQTNIQTFDALEYASQVSGTLCEIINNISGISNAKVVVVVNQSPTYKYLTEDTSSGVGVVYLKNGSTSQPLVVTQFLPEITGILVVAKGVENLQLKNNLLNAISAVYNVNISCIDILEGK